MTARHGLITSLTFHLAPPLHASTDGIKAKQAYLDEVALTLVGKRYETLDDAEVELSADGTNPRLEEVHHEVITWLRRVM